MRVLCALIMLSAMASYVWSFLNRFDGFSATSLDRGLLVWASFVGVTLFIADSGMTREQVYKVVDVIIIMGTIVAAIGVIQACCGSTRCSTSRSPASPRPSRSTRSANDSVWSG